MLMCMCPTAAPSVTLASTCGGAPFLLFMGLIDAFLQLQCDIEDPCRRFPTPQLLSEYDFIVVGGGSAGSVVASRLSEVAQWNVLLIEAGGEEPVGSQVPSMFTNYVGSAIDWVFKTEPEKNACLNQPEQRCTWPRGKVIGGTSVLTGMMYMRGTQKDYNGWAALGNTGWSWDEVLPYFLKSENNLQLDQMSPGYHSSGGLLTVAQFPYTPPFSSDILKAGEELGYQNRDLNGPQHAGFAIAQATQVNGVRLSSSKAFLRPFAHRPNLHVLLKTRATRVVVNPGTKVAEAVEIIQNGGIVRVRASKEVILSSGAVGSPQLLLHSGVGPKKDLKRVGVQPVHDLPGVGKNLHNHVSFMMNFFIDEPNAVDLNWKSFSEYLARRNGLMSGTGLSAVTAFVNSQYADPAGDNPDLQYFFNGYLANCAKTGLAQPVPSNSPRSIKILPVVLHTQSRGYLKLRDNDTLSRPLIYAKYYSHPNDIKVMLDGIKFALSLSQTEALKKHGIRLDTTVVKGCESFQFNTDPYWECAAKTNTSPENHQGGSCKMGPNCDKTAVVNPSLQVHGIDKLRVIDASIMPLPISGNTNAPSIMIGEKGSELIKTRWLV